MPIIILPVKSEFKVWRRVMLWSFAAMATASASSFSARTNQLNPTPVRQQPGFSEKIFQAQVALVCQGISSGSIDGLIGPNTRGALKAFQKQEFLLETGELDRATEQRLFPCGPLYTNYVVAQAELDRLLPLGQTWLAKSQQPRLDYETVLELVAEKSQSHPNLIQQLNPEIVWERILPGTTVRVPCAIFPAAIDAAALLKISLSERRLQAFDAATNLLAHFPCSIGRRVEQRPVGQLQIAAMARHPNYTFDPELFPESAEGRELGRKLLLQPGPNNPVGTVWIGLDKPGYGIHGTPRPEQVGRAESHGCFRLTNWDAEYLVGLARLGTLVIVEP